MFAIRLKELRKKRKISQYELAIQLEFSRGKLANYEQGTREPDFDTLEKIADFFSVSTDYLIGREVSTEKLTISNPPLTFGERLRDLRKQETSLTIKDFAEKMGVSPSTISMYERGEREPDFETIKKIASYFDVTTDYLLTHENLNTVQERTSSAILGNRLKKLRKEKKLTQQDLASFINVTHVSISGYESGRRSPDTSTLQKLADFFAVTTDYLLGRETTSVEELNTSSILFGERIRNLRKEKKLSQKELAAQLNISNVVLSRYELDDRKPDFHTLEEIADFFDVSIDYLIGRSNVKNPEQLLFLNIDNVLTPYQKEIVDFFAASESLSFHEKPENLLDALEEFEIFYEMLKKREERKK